MIWKHQIDKAITIVKSNHRHLDTTQFSQDTYDKLTLHERYIYLSYFVCTELDKDCEVLNMEFLISAYRKLLDINQTTDEALLIFEGIPKECTLVMEMLRMFMKGVNGSARRRLKKSTDSK